MATATVIDSPAAWLAIRPAWDALWARTEAPLSLSWLWLDAYFSAFESTAKRTIVTVANGEELIAGWPLFLATPQLAGSRRLGLGELHLIGDVGGVQRSLLCAAGEEERVAESLVECLMRYEGWHLLEAPVVSRRMVEALERAAARRGGLVERAELYGRPYLELPSKDRKDRIDRVDALWPVAELERVVTTGSGAPAQRALVELVSRSGLREEGAAVLVPELEKFLALLLPTLEAEGSGRIDLVKQVDDTIVGASLVIVDRDRHVELLRAVSPSLGEREREAIGDALVRHGLRAAIADGAHRFELSEDDAPQKSARTRIQRIRLWSGSTVGRVRRSVEWLGRSRADRPAPLGTPGRTQWLRLSPGWRALDSISAPEAGLVARAVQRVANVTTMHLYRGELFVAPAPTRGGPVLQRFGAADFDRLLTIEQETLLGRLELDAASLKQKWQRGDTAVLATIDGRPAGIGWFTQTAVDVPAIERAIRPGAGEAYIFDLFVSPEERGRGVAPAMLAFMAGRLRELDIYRAWALIERSNTASTRAFERAGWASVADVLYARMGLTTRLVLRPPDPEAQRLFGVEVR